MTIRRTTTRLTSPKKSPKAKTTKASATVTAPAKAPAKKPPTKKPPAKRPIAPAPKTPPAPASADPVAVLMALDERVTEYARAAKVKMTAAVYALCAMDGMLFDDDGHARSRDAARVYTNASGAETAILRLVGDTIVLQFAAPKDRSDLASVAVLYTPVSGKPGWLEFRRPATKDPRPSLAANLGSVIGQARFETRRRGG